jgi:hypothetical protein
MGPSLSFGGWIVCLAMFGGMQSVSTPAVAASPQEAPRPDAQPRNRSAADAPTARIRGQVTDDLGNPVARVWGHASREWTEGTPGEGRQVDIAAGQTVERVAIVLRRGAVLVGRIVDDSGAPVPDVAVRALQRVTRRGRPRLVAAERTATTDDRGEYRLWGIADSLAKRVAQRAKDQTDQNGVYRAEGLAPGRYHVAALPHVDEDSMTDATVLSSLRAVSESVALALGSPQRLDLRATEGR